MKYATLILLFFLTSDLLRAATNIIPQPCTVVESNTTIALPNQFTLSIIGKDDKKLFSYSVKTLSEDHGMVFAENDPRTYSIILEIDADVDKDSAFLGKEGYSLISTERGTTIRATSSQGAFYGIQTLRQLIHAEDDGTLTVPQVEISDAPRFAWRGMHLDVSRHFYPKEFIKKYIDYLATYKMNVFHWHLVDGPGWRMEIKKYPRLTQVGAWRKDKTAGPWNWRDTELELEGQQADSYGGYYTQDDIREIVAYAADRYIAVVPEIEMPGHSYAALVAYPEFACPTNNIAIDGLRGKDVLCVGNEKSYQFVQDVLDETMALFPSSYIHLGADEVSTEAWQECPLCQALKRKLDLADEKSLQSGFMKRMERYIHDQGRTMVGWDEIIEDELPARATVMVWRDEKFIHRAIEQQHPVVLCPGEFYYFDQYQSKSKEGELPAIGGFLPTRQVYNFDPIPAGLSKENHSLILGGQGCVWTEYIQTPAQVETMIFPRMPALAEALWTPALRKSWSSFERRVKAHKSTWRTRGISFYPGELDGIDH